MAGRTERCVGYDARHRPALGPFLRAPAPPHTSTPHAPAQHPPTGTATGRHRGGTAVYGGGGDSHFSTARAGPEPAALPRQRPGTGTAVDGWPAHGGQCADRQPAHAGRKRNAPGPGNHRGVGCGRRSGPGRMADAPAAGFHHAKRHHHRLAHAFGIMLATPLILSWRYKLQRSTTQQRIPEGALAYVLTFVACLAIFSDWHTDLLDPVANAYWMFLFITWVGVRLGMFGTVGLLCMIALQALWGAHQRTGFFARDLDGSQGFGYWSYMMILALVGMSLAAYMAERRRQKAALRVAAIAFECQEGILVTDKHSVILQANLSFLRTSGYARYEVLGRTPHFLLAPPEATPDAAPGPGPSANFAPPHNLQRREWHQRKSGEIYPVWITLSPVRDQHEHITHYVLTLTDITDLRQEEEQRRQMEQAHRDALVQEVHHRIKNNLQGVMGMLRTLDHKHPRLHGPINQVIGQVHSIAAIHGLQGSTTADRVRLSDLVCAIAGGIESLWDTPIHVDTPHWWKACYITPSEAVPVALVLNELILNAVKHGGKAQQDVRIQLHDGLQAGSIQITISNPGRWPESAAESNGGLGLIAALMPRHGAQLTRAQRGDWAVLDLELAPPVIHLESSDAPPHAFCPPLPPHAS